MTGGSWRAPAFAALCSFVRVCLAVANTDTRYITLNSFWAHRARYRKNFNTSNLAPWMESLSVFLSSLVSGFRTCNPFFRCRRACRSTRQLPASGISWIVLRGCLQSLWTATVRLIHLGSRSRSETCLTVWCSVCTWWTFGSSWCTSGSS